MAEKNPRVLFLSWKDITHPSAGGAELVTDTLAEHLAKTCEVVYFTSSYTRALATEKIHGYTIIRRGNAYTVYIHAFMWWHVRRIYTQKHDFIIDQVHGFPFFSLLYYKHPTIITLVMEVAGELWNNTQSLFVEKFGKILEKIWLYLYKKHTIVTISESTKQDLIAHGIPQEQISIIPMFSNVRCEQTPQKSETPTLLIIGRIAPVKQIEHAIDAYTIARETISSLKLVIIGKTERAYTDYAEYITQKISNNPNITLIENATEHEKLTRLQRSHLLLMTSKKEGYGLVILEAATCGTPTIGYRVPGVQDAVVHKKTGFLVNNATPAAMATAICEIIKQPIQYREMQEQARLYAATHTKEKTANAFQDILTLNYDKKSNNKNV